MGSHFSLFYITVCRSDHSQMQIVYPKYKKILQNYVAYVVHIKPEIQDEIKQPRKQEEQEN